jgi:hypothetical protein
MISGLRNRVSHKAAKQHKEYIKLLREIKSSVENRTLKCKSFSFFHLKKEKSQSYGLQQTMIVAL